MRVEYSGEDESTYFYKLVPDGDRIQTVIIGLDWKDWQTKWKRGSMSNRITLQRISTEELEVDVDDLMRDWHGGSSPEVASYDVDDETLRVEFETIELNREEIFDACEGSIEAAEITYNSI